MAGPRDRLTEGTLTSFSQSSLPKRCAEPKFISPPQVPHRQSHYPLSGRPPLAPSPFSLQERDDKKRDLAAYHEWHADAAAFEQYCAQHGLNVTATLRANFDAADHITSKHPKGCTVDEFEKEYNRLRGGAVIMHTIEPVWTHHTGR